MSSPKNKKLVLFLLELPDAQILTDANTAV